MQKTERSPDEYLASLPDTVRNDMMTLDAMVSEVFEGQSRVLWEGVFWGGSEQKIIGYGDLVQKQSRGRIVEWFKVGLACQKDYLSLYVNATEGHEYVAEKYKDTLGKVKTGKSSISFRTLDDVNHEALRTVLHVARTQLASP